MATQSGSTADDVSSIGVPVLEVEKWRELDERKKQIAKRKTELEAQVLCLQERRKDLEIREMAFRDIKQKYGKSIRDVEMRRDRAITVAAEEKEPLNRKNVEIAALTLEVRKLQADRDAMLLEHRQSEMQQFLEKVIEASEGEFKQTKEVIPKYNILKNIRQELTDKLQEIKKFTTDGLENIDVSIINWRKQIDELRLRAVQLQEQVATAKTEEDRKQREWEDSIDASTDWQVDADRIKRAIFTFVANIYGDRKREEDLINDSPLHQLNVIQEYLEDSNFIIAELGKKPA